MAWWMLIIGLLAGLLLANFVIQIGFIRGTLAIFDNSPYFRTQLLPPDPDAERFETKTTDGVTIRGCLYRQTERPPRGLIVFCHEFGSNSWSAMLYSSALWKAGFHVLAFDFRNHGESDSLPSYRATHWLTTYETNDLFTVLDYVKQQPDLNHLPLGLYGISRGGSAALFVAAQRKEVRCVAADGAFGTSLLMSQHARRWSSLVVGDRLSTIVPWWHIRSTLWLTRLTSQFQRRVRYAMLEKQLPKLRQLPLLIISGGRDTYILPEVSRELCQLTGKPDVLWLIPNAKHNQARQVDPTEYDRRLVNFFGVLDGQAEAPAQMDGDAEATKQASNKLRKAR